MPTSVTKVEAVAKKRDVRAAVGLGGVVQPGMGKFKIDYPLELKRRGM